MKEHTALFGLFNHVYLFGSILDSCICQNDVDILIIYEKYSKEIEIDLKKIQNELEKVIDLPVDLTALSNEEEQETAFLERIESRYLKIK